MRHRSHVVRALAYSACVAMTAAVLAAPAQATAAPVPITYQGGDLVISLDDGGVPQATMQQIINTSWPQSVGAPTVGGAGYNASTWLNTVLTDQYNHVGAKAAISPPVPGPPDLTGGTVTVSGSTVTVDIPAATVQQDDSTPLWLAAAWAAITGAIGGLIIFGVCLVSFLVAGSLVSAFCSGISVFAGTMLFYVVYYKLTGTPITPERWGAIFAAALVYGGVAFLGPWFTAWMVRVLPGGWAALGQKIVAWMRTQGWLGSAANQVADDVGAELGSIGGSIPAQSLSFAEQNGMAVPTSGTGTVTSGFAGTCLDDFLAKMNNNDIVVRHVCNGGANQNWTMWSNGMLEMNARCLNVVNNGTAVRTKVILLDCNGQSGQQWQQVGNALVNPPSGLCLDDPDAVIDNQLQIYTCNGSPAQQWTLPPKIPAPPNGSSCDLYAFYGTPCVAAYSMVRALFSGYNGPLYQVKRASDGATADIGLLSAGGYVNAAAQDSFCSNTGCTITKIYDQSPEGNNLTIGGPGGPGCSSAPGDSCSGQADQGASASLAPVTVGGNPGTKAYGLDITPGVGYANDTTKGVAVGNQPEGTYMVASGTHVNGQCCMDFGNAETNRFDNGNGHMDAVRIGTGAGIPGTCWFTPCNGSGPWVGVDMENGTFLGANGSYLGNTPVPDNFVTAMAKNDGQTTYAIKTGDAQSGGLTTQWEGALPNIGGYAPMQKEGGIVLGTGGDNSNAGTGTWFEGVMTAGYPSDAADNAVQANIIAAGYAGNSAGSPPGSPSGNSAAGTAGQAVLHDGFTSIYTVNRTNHHLQETYLSAAGAPWGTQDLSATVGTPAVKDGTKPVAVYHDGYTSVYTVDASNGHLQETFLAALCVPNCAPGQGWATQDLSATVGTPPTAATPGAVFHSGYTSVYTVDASNGDLQETFLATLCAPNCAPGQGWATQDLSAHVGTPPVLGRTSPVAVLHDGYTSVYTVDASNGDLQETFLAAICAPNCAPGQGWATQDLSAHVGTPPTAVTPGAVYHSGYTSVYTVNSNGDLQETFLAAICAPNCSPGQGWATQDLSAHVGTPRIAIGTSPVALFHDGYTSVYTVDAGATNNGGHLDETYLAAICAPNCAPGQGWAWQDLSVHPGTPPTAETPIALLHLDQGGGLHWVSVWTIRYPSGDLDETYLPALCAPNCSPGQGWHTQDLSANYGTPPAT